MSWVYTYNEGGPDALSYRRTGGASPLFAPAETEKIIAVIGTEPTTHDLPGHGWTLKKLG
ncbi:helix-turn-helix domain-containing protein [Fimbriiglobus ruber]|uniref:Uncharacterized protein n=1 Tax=Fimbriiglobus ruber TaxID=1908690 RepID=A0A225DS61_9BACT|nr:helix-turn-helix domain-containing protein [Fimbriiglobus ruber]OWK44252.1 hypothetical protein FRUB_02184 [Fimbriiglobus ruber]